MLDEEYGGLALDAGAVPSSVGLIMPLEAQGYETIGDGRTTTLLDDFSPADALRRGADACKILLPYRADHEPSATAQDALVSATVAACHEIGLPLVVEPVAVSLVERDSGRPSASAYRRPRARRGPAAGAARRRPAQAALPGVRPGRATARPRPPTHAASWPSPAATRRGCCSGAGADGETFIEQIADRRRGRRIGLPRRSRDLGRGPGSGSRSGRAAGGDDRPSAVRAMPGHRRADRAAPRRGRGRLTAATDRPACRPSSPGS